MVQIERRNSLRRKIQIPVLCWEADDELRKGKGKEIATKDLSGSGIAFYSRQIYPINTVLHIDIYLPNQKVPVSCQLRVVSIEVLLHGEEFLIGASFFNMSDEDRARIITSIDKLDLYVLLESMINGEASDMHLTVGKPPKVRRRGRLLTMAADVIEPGQVKAMLYPLMSREDIQFFEKNKEMDFAFSPNIHSRFRINMHSQKGFVEAALRSVPTRVKTFEELGLIPATMEHLCQEKSGLILIAGTTGSGKTTTMMSMMDHININQEKVIVTVEDPIEYLLKSQMSIIKQRELGNDTRSYAEALRRVLRQDPDVVCIGELLDGECLLAAMRAAETGHLVVSTVHAPDTVAAIERLVNLFPPEHAMSMRQQLSSCLIGILFQTLVPTINNRDRVVATELMLNTTAVKNLIREGNYKLLGNVLQTGRAQGMYMLKDTIRNLKEKGVIDEEVARNYTTDEFLAAEDLGVK